MFGEQTFAQLRTGFRAKRDIESYSFHKQPIGGFSITPAPPPPRIMLFRSPPIKKKKKGS